MATIYEVLQHKCLFKRPHYIYWLEPNPKHLLNLTVEDLMAHDWLVLRHVDNNINEFVTTKTEIEKAFNEAWLDAVEFQPTKKSIILNKSFAFRTLTSKIKEYK